MRVLGGTFTERANRPCAAFLPACSNQALHGGDCGFRKGETACFRANIECGKAAAGRLNPAEYISEEYIPGKRSRRGSLPRRTGTFPIGFVLLQHGAIVRQIVHGKISSAGVENSAVKCIATVTTKVWFSGLFNRGKDFGFELRRHNVERNAHAEASGNISFRSVRAR